MITHVRFQNFKALKNAELKLGTFNVIIGPNGSGKSSVLQGLEAMAKPESFLWRQTVTVGMPIDSLLIDVSFKNHSKIARLGVLPNGNVAVVPVNKDGRQIARNDFDGMKMGADAVSLAKKARIFSFQISSMSNPVDPKIYGPLNGDGSNLAGAITFLRDKDEDTYNQLRLEMQRWIPEYDSVICTNDQNGFRKLALRQKTSHLDIPATQLSEGTLLALGLLTIVHQPDAPVLIGLEEPDRGLHPRLLRELRDALYRLSFPADFGIKRAPIQVVVTTICRFSSICSRIIRNRSSSRRKASTARRRSRT